MRNILLCTMAILASSLLTSCEGQTKPPNDLPSNEGQTRLPSEIPQGTGMIYISEGGFLPSFFKIVISGNTMTVTRQSAETDQKTDVREARLSDGELKNLYRILVENKFDLIRPNQEIKVPDGKSRSIELTFNQKRFYAIQGDGIKTTQPDAERFHNIENAFGALIKKYDK